MGLFKPAWQSNNKEVAMRAVEKVNNKYKLTLIAKEAPLEEVRFMAMLRIDAVCGDGFNAMKLFEENIDSQPLLAAIAMEASFKPNWRLTAVGKITDQSIIFSLTASDDRSIRAVAVSNSTNSKLLANILENDKDDYVRSCAIKNKHLTDENVLAKYIIKNQDSLAMDIDFGRIRKPLKSILEKFNDYEILSNIEKTLNNTKLKDVMKSKMLELGTRMCQQQNQHDWDGCRCRRCGFMGDEQQHNWDGCKCKSCGRTRDEEHDWDGCVCKRCNKKRDKEHDWDGCKCKSCGKTRDIGHDWEGGLCKRCRQLDSRCPSCKGTTTEIGSDYYSGSTTYKCTICGDTHSRYTSMGHG